MKRVNLKAGALTAPIPPAIVTVGEGESANALTVAWTGILATVPPKTYISVRPCRHSYSLLKESGEFVINLPPSSLAKEVDYIGIYTGARVNKFDKCKITKTESLKVKAPTVKECPIALECRVTDVLKMGSHDVFIADIVSVSAREDIMDEEGKIHFEKADLLAYAHGEYYTLGERVGRFGFSTDKDKKPSRRRKSGERKERTSENSEAAEEKKKAKAPFYLDLPKSVRRKSGQGKVRGVRRK